MLFQCWWIDGVDTGGVVGLPLETRLSIEVRFFTATHCGAHFLPVPGKTDVLRLWGLLETRHWLSWVQPASVV